MGVREGVVLLTYSSLISAADSGASRLQQLVDWCGDNFDGLVVFDGARCPSLCFCAAAVLLWESSPRTALLSVHALSRP